MTHEREREIFEASLELPEEDRERFIHEACDDDAAVARRIYRLLEAHDRAGTESSGLEIPAAVADDPKEIGPYRILRRIGAGGMGVVYLAEQTSPVARRVALKVIKLGMDTKEVIARFESERQALALMNHPNIARMLDAAATADGRPYFVMEHVHGISITAYCDQNHLPIDERLDLFIQVCEGVQHAHQKGVIHRDLKPTNVLVEIEGDRSVPKIIDFGISKAIQRPLIEKTLFTRLGALIGTPEYMSPEQAEMSGIDIDTRTDVYSLGVLLHELSVGALPFDVHLLGLDEIRQKIREVKPPKPSLRLGALGSAASDVAANRGTDRLTLAKRLRGDLDWITMTALEKDRTRRYSSASEFAADVRRHLAFEPVLAGPPSVRYRLGKFAHRNRVQLAAAAAVLMVLIAGMIGTNVGLVRARAEAERARTQAAIAKAINTFLNDDLLAAPAPQRRGIDVSMREILATAGERIEGRFSDEPLVEAAIRRTIGDTYVHLGEYPTAEPHLERALGLYRQTPEVEPRDLSTAMSSLARLYFFQARFDEAERLYLESMELRPHASGVTDSVTLSHMNNLGLVYTRMGRHEEAEELLGQALEMGRRVLGEDHPQTASAMAALANLYWYTARYEDAGGLYAEAVDVRRRVLGQEHPRTLVAMNNLGMLYTQIGRRAEAEELLRQTLEIRRRVLGKDHPQTTTTLVNLGNLFWHLARYEDAGGLYAEALETRLRVSGEEHHETLIVMNNLALTYQQAGRLGEAEALFDKTVALRHRVLGDEHPATLTSRHNLALVYRDQERYREAERLMRETLETRRRVVGDAHPATLLAVADFADLQNELGQHQAAQSIVERTLAAASKELEQLPWEAAPCQTQLGIALTRLGDYQRAEAVLLAAHSTLEANPAAEADMKLAAVHALVDLYEAQDRNEEAARWRNKLPATESDDT